MQTKETFYTAALVITACGLFAQSPAARPALDTFEVAAIKPTAPDDRGGRFITMQGAHRFVVKNYTLKRDEQMAMLRKLLADRFQLTFHREEKELAIYALTVAKSGSKLKESTAPPDEPPVLINRVFPDRILLPARNATMAQFASMMQRAVLDRPVVDKTGLSGKYDFDLEWTPDETQFGGQGPPATPESTKPDLFAAIQRQLGLRLEATKGMVAVLVIDRAERPSAN
jgi:uncharacterized protein (TIGR03435 family)